MAKSNFVTPEIVCSYPNLFDPSDYNEKYGLSVAISKDDSKSLKELDKLFQNLVEEKWGKKAIPLIGKKITTPLRDGDDERGDDDIYQNKMFFNANSKRRPGVVDSNLKPVLDSEEVYPGCIVRASINFYAWEYEGKKMIAAGLNNVMKVKDGDRIGGGSDAESDFGDFASDDDDVF